DGTLHDRPCAEALRPTAGNRPCDLLLERHEDAGPGDEPEDPERGEVRVLTRAKRPGRDGEEAEGGHPGDEHADGDRHRAFGKGGEDAVQLAVGDVGLLVGRGGPAREAWLAPGGGRSRILASPVPLPSARTKLRSRSRVRARKATTLGSPNLAY